MTISQEQLKKVLTYNPETGDFTWISDSLRTKKGTVLRSIKKSGVQYYRTRIYGEHHLLHRLAWLYMTGEFPKQQIDHINRNSLDNRWKNLRDCSASENMLNRDLSIKSKTGIKGLYIVTINNNTYYCARLTKENKFYQRYFGLDAIEEAKDWLKYKRIELFGCNFT